jgi:hypothetical protein
MQAFLGKPEVKQMYLQRVEQHAKADEIIHGTYWSRGKGCAVGCTVHTSNEPHSRYPVELGIPEWLAWLEDSIFESLPNGNAKQWPVRFLKSIRVGADLEPVRPKFLKWLLVDPKNGVLRLVNVEHDKEDAYTTKVRLAIEQVVKMLDDWIETGERDESAAWSAAESAASAAESAARSAAESAAESAARSAAESAASAASAAWSAAESAQSEQLLKLLAEA